MHGCTTVSFWTTTHQTTFSSGCKGLSGDHHQKNSRNGTCRDRSGTHGRNQNNKTLKKLALVEFLKSIVRWTKLGIWRPWLWLGRVKYRFHHWMKWRNMTRITSYHQATIFWRQHQRLCVLSVVYDFLGPEANSNLTLYFGWLRYLWWMVSGDRIVPLGQSPIGRFKPYVGCPNGRGGTVWNGIVWRASRLVKHFDGATLRLSLEPATCGIFVQYFEKRYWIVFQRVFLSKQQRDKTLAIHVLDLKNYAKFSFFVEDSWQPFQPRPADFGMLSGGFYWWQRQRGIQLFKRRRMDKFTNGSWKTWWPRCKCNSIFQPEFASLNQKLAAAIPDIDDILWFPLGYLLLGTQLNDRNVRTSFRGNVWVLWALCVRPQCKAPWQALGTGLDGDATRATDDPMRCRMSALLYNSQRYQAAQLQIWLGIAMDWDCLTSTTQVAVSFLQNNWANTVNSDNQRNALEKWARQGYKNLDQGSSTSFQVLWLEVPVVSCSLAQVLHHLLDKWLVCCSNFFRYWLWTPNFLATDNQFGLMFLGDFLSTIMILSGGICFHLNKWTNVVRGVLSAMTLRFVRGLPGKRRLRIRSCRRERE